MYLYITIQLYSPPFEKSPGTYGGFIDFMFAISRSPDTYAPVTKASAVDTDCDSLLKRNECEDPARDAHDR